jgi:type II secretory ATPase GspE/PulE/Tfp pilus assembly ATPase PilB-like protein
MERLRGLRLLRSAFIVSLAVACAIVACAGARPVAAQPADAGRPKMQEVDPNAPPQPAAAEPAPVPRRPTGSLATLPTLIWWLLVVGWLGTTAWAGRDEHRPKSFDTLWLPILAFPFFVLALGAWWLPWSAAACGLTATAWLGSFLAYGLARDAALKPDQRLLSFRNAFYAGARSAQPLLKKMGIKLDLESRSLADSLPDVSFTAVPPDGSATPQALLDQAQAMPGFETFRELMQRSIANRAGQLLVEIDQQGGKVRQRIDGLWQPLRRIVKRRQGLKVVDEMEDSDPLDRETTAALVAAVRTLCGMPPKPVKRQGGRFQLGVQKKDIPCGVALEAAEGGMRLVVDLDLPPPVFKSLSALGMPEPLAAKLQQALTLEHGLVVVSAPPGEGLTTTFTQVVLTADRLLRDFVILEDAAAPIKEIQNVKPMRWGGPEKVAPAAALETAMRGYPTALVVPDLRDKALAAELAARSTELLVIVGLQATDAAQAVEKLLALGMPPETLARTLQAATCQRLVRRLCPKCAESFQPPADLLARLKLPAVESIAFKKATPNGCPACSGTGHLSRSGLFELAGGPTVAKAIAAKVDRATFVKAAVRDGMQRFPEAGVAMVVAGTTSLDEVQRVLKKG